MSSSQDDIKSNMLSTGAGRIRFGPCLLVRPAAVSSSWLCWPLVQIFPVLVLKLYDSHLGNQIYSSLLEESP